TPSSPGTAAATTGGEAGAAVTSTTGAPPQSVPAQGRDDAYGYDVERVDPRAPEQMGPGTAGRPRRRRPWARWALFALSFLCLAAAAIALYFFVILPLGFGTSLVAFTAALVPVAIVLAAVWWI